MSLLKSFSEFLLEKSSNEISEIFPLKFKSRVTGSEKEVSKESLLKSIDSLLGEDDMTSSEYETLYQFATRIGDRGESDIEKELGVEKRSNEDVEYNKRIDSLLEVNRKIKKIYEDSIGTKEIKDFKEESNREKIRKFYKGNQGLEGLIKDGEIFGKTVEYLYGKSGYKDEEKDDKNNIKLFLDKILEIIEPSKEKINYIKSETLVDKKAKEEAKKAIEKETIKSLKQEIEEGGYDVLRGILKRIIDCISSSYGCLTQINRITIIENSSEREKKNELMGTFKEDGSLLKQGSIYTDLKKLIDKSKEILPGDLEEKTSESKYKQGDVVKYKKDGKEEEKKIEKVENDKFFFKGDKGEEFSISKDDIIGKKAEKKDIIDLSELDQDKEGSLKNLVFSLRDKLKDLQGVSDSGVMTQKDWESYVKDKEREGFRYQDLKQSFDFLQGAVDNYCTGKNSSNAMEIYFGIFEDYIRSLS